MLAAAAAHAATMVTRGNRDRDDLPQGRLKGLLRVPLLPDGAVGPRRRSVHRRGVVGATLDRNGLRHGRWVETTDGYVVLGSEIGLSTIPPSGAPPRAPAAGKLFLVDLERGRIVEDGEVKREVACASPMASGTRTSVPLRRAAAVLISDDLGQPMHLRQRAFGYCLEDLRVLFPPMASEGAEPIGSMGNDTRAGGALGQAPPLFSYFKQLFAQVTNPPIDPIREEDRDEPLDEPRHRAQPFGETPEHAHKLCSTSRSCSTASWRRCATSTTMFKARTIDITWPIAQGADGNRGRARRVCTEAHDAIAEGVNILVLSDRRWARAARDPIAAGGLRRPPSPRARGHAAARGDHPRVGRAP